MDEERLQQEIRRFLKTFGVSANREIADAVREAVDVGEVAAGEPVAIRARVEIEGVARPIVVEGAHYGAPDRGPPEACWWSRSSDAA